MNASWCNLRPKFCLGTTLTVKDQMQQINLCVFGWLRDTPLAFVFHLWLSRCVCMLPSEIYAHSFTAPAEWPYYVSHHKSMTHTVNWQNPLRQNEGTSSAACGKKRLSLKLFATWLRQDKMVSVIFWRRPVTHSFASQNINGKHPIISQQASNNSSFPV